MEKKEYVYHDCDRPWGECTKIFKQTGFPWTMAFMTYVAQPELRCKKNTWVEIEFCPFCGAKLAESAMRETE